MSVAKSVLLKSPASRRAVALMGRLGYGARGTIYALIGFSAARATIDPGHPAAGFGEALKLFHYGWADGALLILIAAGLACFAIWLAIAAVYRRDHPGRTHWVLVGGMLGDAAVYIAFVGSVLGMVFGALSGGDHELQSWVGWFFSSGFGRTLVGLAGAIVAGCGAGLIAWGAVGNIQGPLELPRAEKRLVNPIGRYGTVGRGAAIALVGGYLCIAAIHGNPREAHELGGILDEMRGLSWGAGVTAAFAVGFIGSGLSDFLTAAFRRFDPTDPSAVLRRATRRSSARGR